MAYTDKMCVIHRITVAKIMRFSEENDPNAKLVRSYEPGTIRINNEFFDHSIIISDGKIQTWPITHSDQIDIQALITAIAQNTEVLLIGTGQQQHMLDLNLFKDLLIKNIGVEVMDSGAASRTYNILLAEGRQVALALIIT